MNSLFDILLPKPLPDLLLRGLLFSTFKFHMIFVLLTLGTAMLAVYYFIDFQWGGKTKEIELDKRILRSFMALKSLAVVLGVAPLLLMQVTFSVPFFTALTLLAPYWLGIIVFLIIAFLSFDVLGHGIEAHRYVHLIWSIIALTFLLLVPGVWVAILTTAENSDIWLALAKNGYRLAGPAAGHWLFRYLHVLGAALVFGAAFHYFFSAKHESDRSSLQKWLVAGMLLQFILGPLLFMSLLEKPDYVTMATLSGGIAAAAFLLWVIFAKAGSGGLLNCKIVIPLLMIVLLAMLLTRQFIQNRKILPLEKTLAANAEKYGKALKPYSTAALNRYRASLPLYYDSGGAIFLQSCAFCHGKNADGHGLEAQGLNIPPENLAAMRTTREYLQQVITRGIAGTGMGYFSIYDRYQLDDLIDYLNQKYQVLSGPGPVPAAVSSKAMAQAEETYQQTCAVCHGLDGKGSQLSQGFKPPPPNLAVYSLTPARTLTVITNGYPGTMMPAFGELDPEVRWGLVKVV